MKSVPRKNAGLVKKELLTDANPSLHEYFNLRQVRCYGYQMLIVNTFHAIIICLPFWNVCNNEYCSISGSRLNNHVKSILNPFIELKDNYLFNIHSKKKKWEHSFKFLNS